MNQVGETFGVERIFLFNHQKEGEPCEELIFRRFHNPKAVDCSSTVFRQISIFDLQPEVCCNCFQ